MISYAEGKSYQAVCGPRLTMMVFKKQGIKVLCEPWLVNLKHTIFVILAWTAGI